MFGVLEQPLYCLQHSKFCVSAEFVFHSLYSKLLLTNQVTDDCKRQMAYQRLPIRGGVKMYGGPFDFSHDGGTDGGELALGFALMSKLDKGSGPLYAFKNDSSELSDLHDTLIELLEKEPDDCFSEEHDKWETQREELEESIVDLGNTIEDY